MAIPLRNARNHSDATFMWVLNRSYRDQCYIQLKRDYTTINIGSICGSPSLTAINEAFGFGEKLLGGYITSLPIQVEEEVKLPFAYYMAQALRIYPLLKAGKSMS